VVRGGWSAQISGGISQAPGEAPSQGPDTVVTAPEPTRRWSANRWQPGGGLAPLWSSGVTSFGLGAATPTAPTTC
jgi:hypothetical protein